MGLFGPSTKAEYDELINKKTIKLAKWKKIAAGSIWGSWYNKDYAKQQAKIIQAEIMELKAKKAACSK